MFFPTVVSFLLAGTLACSSGGPQIEIQLDGVAPEVATAVRAARDRVNTDPKSAAGFLALGIVCEANGLTGEARTAYERAVALDDRHSRAWYRLAIARGRTGQIEPALAAMDRAIALEAGHAPSHWRRGLWLLDRSQATEARLAFEKATTLDPANPGGWVGLARVALLEKRPAEAVDRLETFLSKHPGDLYAMRLLGTAYQRLGRTEEAEYALSVAAPGEPSWPDSWDDELQTHRVGFAQTLKQATAHILSGNYVAAVPLLEQLSRERPDDLPLAHQLGLSYVAAGRSSEGLTVLRKALDRDPDNLETHLRLASAFINTRDFAQASKYADRAVALSPELGRAHETRGMALWRGGRGAEAYGAFLQAVRYDPKNLLTHVWMGWIALERNKPADALNHFETAALRNPLLADAFVGIGVVNLRLMRLDEADAALLRAEKLAPDTPRLAEARGQLDAMRSRMGKQQ